jgi:glycosyltransferase involved in cell wall biosynthesis
VTRLTVAHLIESASRGGACRALFAAAAAQPRSDVEHRVLSLQPPTDAGAAIAHRAGVHLVAAPSVDRLSVELGQADIVHVHFWNSPALYDVLSRPLPSARLALSCWVSGEHPPHVLTRELIEYADLTVATCAYTAELPVFRHAAQPTSVIPSAGGWDRVRDIRPQPHDTFNVGYIGTVDPAKMHPSFVALAAGIDVPGLRIVVCGSGNGFARLAREAEALGVADRFELCGYVEDIGSILARLDVFGYPLCRENYSAAELVLQEAMYCGVPPVVLPYGGAQRTVVHDRTGLVAPDEAGYVTAVQRLHRDAGLRRRLGRTAAAHVRAHWKVEDAATGWLQAYSELAAKPKRARQWPSPRAPTRATPAAARFLQSLGGAVPALAASVETTDPENWLAADAAIGSAAPVLASADSGGILHWRLHHPADPWLRLWAGLVLQARGRRALAAAEFSAAATLGLEEPRVQPHLARAMAGTEPANG